MRAILVGSLVVALALGLWASCGGDDSGTPSDGGDDGDTAGGCTTTDQCHQGFRCVTPACNMVLPTLDPSGTNADLLDCPAPLTPLTGTVSVTVYVEDFQDNVAVEGAMVDLFLDNLADDTIDRTIGPADASGLITGVAGLPQRGVIAYRVHGGALPGGDVRATIEYDVAIPETDGQQVRFLSVSDRTYRLIPTILGIAPDASHGIIAGSFEDCAADPQAVEGIVARLLNSSGQDCHYDLNQRECYSRYFVDEFPSRIDNQSYSSADGLYAIAQVPPGDWTLEIRGRLTGATTEFPFDLLGRKTIRPTADSIVIVDVNPLDTL
jgi:hypothetical protein